MVEETLSHAEETPLGIVMRLRHKHHGDPNVYNHIVMAANGMPGHHRHLPHETNNKIKHKHTFSLNIPEDHNQANEATSVPNEAVSDNSVNVKHSINSIKNLENNSLRMANETQLPLSSSETKDNLLVKSAASDTKDNILVNSASSDMITEINFTEQNNYSEKSQEINNSKKELHSSYSEITTEMNDTDEEISGDYQDESSEESQSLYENSQLNGSELAEKENLKEHYRRILDWIKYEY